MRFPWKPGELKPAGPPETIARGLPQGGHASKGLALGKDGSLYVSFGSQTNSCQRFPDQDRRGPFPGLNPCTELEARAGIWRFDARKTGQTPADAKRYATGMRNPMAMAVEPSTGTLHVATHGRDQLTENWSWPAEAGRENPAEEFGPVTEGADYGWPYCFFDPRAKVKVLNPEYGGDGKKVGDCDKKTQPAIGFPAHWAPNGVTFYTGRMFPPEYHGGAFIAFHGSWNRAPAPQEGYRVVFVPFRNGKALGTYATFAAPAGPPTSIRPTGLAVGPDGSLYFSADAQGKIWRVMRR
jgi:glucose/arabinose dehydrogenase